MKHHDKSAYIVVSIVALILIIASVSVITSKFQNTTRIILGDAVVTAKVAKNDEQHSKGLSGVQQLKDGEGMLFIFKEDDLHGIWMKDMKINIDIVWLNKEKKVIYIVKNATPESYPKKTFKPNKPARYVLEVPSGFVTKNKIVIGTPANFNTNALQ